MFVGMCRLGLGNSGAIATACAVCSGAVGGNRVSCEHSLKLVFRLVVVGHAPLRSQWFGTRNNTGHASWW